MKIDISDDLVKVINEYVNTDWKDGRDPSKFGALNAVAYIGERLVAELLAARSTQPTKTETSLEAARKAHRHAAHVYAGVKKVPGNEARRRATAKQLESAGVAVAIALIKAEND